MSEQVEIIFDLDRASPGSLSAQLVLALRHSIETGNLRPGDQLPPSRALAKRLGISRGTVVTAYEQLTAEGYFTSGQGKGTRVNPQLREVHPATPPFTEPIPSEITHPPTEQPHTLTDLTTRPAWRTAWRKAASSPKLGNPMPVEGDPALRSHISEHLRLMRGTIRDPKDILVTAGAREGLGLILTALGSTLQHRLIVGMDLHGPRTLREVAERHGATVVDLPTDENGIIVTDIPPAVLDVVVITPSFRYPHDTVMPLTRRQELLAWAQRTGVLVIEDDFDSEQRYLHAPLPTFAALDDPHDGVVVTLGSFSATLSVTLAAGFLITPASLRERLLPLRRDLGCPVSPILQLALAELLNSGELRRHVARLRRARVRHETMGQ